MRVWCSLRVLEASSAPRPGVSRAYPRSFRVDAKRFFTGLTGHTPVLGNERTTRKVFCIPALKVFSCGPPLQHVASFAGTTTAIPVSGSALGRSSLIVPPKHVGSPKAELSAPYLQSIGRMDTFQSCLVSVPLVSVSSLAMMPAYTSSTMRPGYRAHSAPHGSRGFAKRRRPQRQWQNYKPIEEIRTPQAVPAAPHPDFNFVGKKVWLVKAVACMSAVQLALALGFVPYFWMNLLSLEPLWRGAFCGSLAVIAGSIFVLTFVAQSRYVSGVFRRKATAPLVTLETPFFLSKRTITCHPDEVYYSKLGLRDLLGRPQRVDASDPDAPIQERELITVQAKGHRMLLDMERVSKPDRLALLQVLGLWDPQAASASETTAPDLEPPSQPKH